jgi:hypothetical protein
MTKKMGRPRLAKKDALGTVFSVRLRPDEARETLAAINASGQAKPDWLRTAILTAARKK